jgi:hypothetical protein
MQYLVAKESSFLCARVLVDQLSAKRAQLSAERAPTFAPIAERSYSDCAPSFGFDALLHHLLPASLVGWRRKANPANPPKLVLES